MECPSLPYKVDLKGASDYLASAKRVLVQLPPGLIQYSGQLRDCIERIAPQAEVIIQLEPTFGGCDLNFPQAREVLGVDLILHIGHTPYPVELASPAARPRRGPRVVFIPAPSKVEPARESVVEAARILQSHGVRRIALVSTVQHVHLLPKLRAIIEEMGLSVEVPRGRLPYFYDGQVIGCDYRTARHASADGFIYVGGGLFHPLGLFLATMKPVVRLDPYSERPEDITGIGERTLRSRLFKVARAMDARDFAIIVGMKTGQYRPWLIELLKKAIEERGRRYTLYASERLLAEDVRSLPPSHDAIIVTSCPRLPIDDLADYHVPVLTPGEAFMALEGRLEPYRFPW